MTKIAQGKYVKVVKGTDDTFDSQYLGMVGFVVDHNENGQTGNTPDDPLHQVSFDLNTVPQDSPLYDKEAFVVESFWSEELEITNKNFLEVAQPSAPASVKQHIKQNN